MTMQDYRQILPLEQPKKACRNLFGPVDHKSTEQLLLQELQEIQKSSIHEWNFDFPCDTPRMGGRFFWETVDQEIIRASTSNEISTECRDDSTFFSSKDNKKAPKRCMKTDDECQRPQKKLYLQFTLNNYMPMKKLLAIHGTHSRRKTELRKSHDRCAPREVSSDRDPMPVTSMQK